MHSWWCRARVHNLLLFLCLVSAQQGVDRSSKICRTCCWPIGGTPLVLLLHRPDRNTFFINTCVHAYNEYRIWGRYFRVRCNFVIVRFNCITIGWKSECSTRWHVQTAKTFTFSVVQCQLCIPAACFFCRLTNWHTLEMIDQECTARKQSGKISNRRTW